MNPVPAIVIPVYNHKTNLRNVVERALHQCSLVIVIDDGSSDGGPETLVDLPVQLVRHPCNQGKGAALLTGARTARNAGATHMITLDADGQHYPEDIGRIWEMVQMYPDAFIVGCRDFTVPHIPRASRFGRAFSAFWMRVQTGVAVHDMQSGFRAYPLCALACLTLSERGYAFEIEVLVRASWAGFAIREVDVRVHYPPAQERVSHFHSLKDNINISLLNTRLTLRALVPVPFRQSTVAADGKVSLRHPMASLHRLLSNKATPAELARAAGISMAISSLPLPGVQSILLLLCIGWFRLNRICALAIIPLAWPPIVPGLGILVGYRLRHGNWLTEFSLRTLGYEAPQRLMDWILGAFCLAPCLGLLVGGIVGALSYVLYRGLREREYDS